MKAAPPTSATRLLISAANAATHLRPQKPHAHPAVLQGITTDRVGRYFELVRVLSEAAA